MVLSRAIYALLALILLFVLYMIYFEESEIWRWGIPPIVLLGIMNYVFQPQIDYWWFQRSERNLDPIEHHFLQKNLYFYRSLSPEEQKSFGRECLRFQHDIEYILQGLPSFPDDLKTIIAAYAMSLRYAFGQKENNPFRHFERIAFYPHPFMSPDIEEVHASESNFEDGVWIFSIDQFIPGITRPEKFFNICLYEMSKVLLSEVDELKNDISNYNDEELEAFRLTFSNISLERIEKWINLKEIDLRAAYITALIIHWDDVSSLPEEELHKIPLGRHLEHLDVLQLRK